MNFSSFNHQLRFSAELNEGASGGMVDGAEPKILAENLSDKWILSEGVRVSDGESNTENVINGNRKEPAVEYGRLEIRDKRDISKARAVEVRSRSNRWDSWESWGVMNMVGRVLGGKLSMDDDDDVEDVNTSEYGRDDKDAWRGVIGQPMPASVSDVEKIVVDKVTLEDVKTSEIGCEANVVANERNGESIVVDKATLEDVNSSEIVCEAIVADNKEAWKGGVVGEPILGDESCVGCIAVDKVKLENKNTSVIGREADAVVYNVAWKGLTGDPISVDKKDVKKIIVDELMLEETNTSQNGCEAEAVENTDTWQGVTGELASENKSGIVSIVVEKGASLDYSNVEEIVADKVMLEEINTSQHGCEADVVEDQGTWRGAIAEKTYENKNDVEGIVVDKVMLEDVKTSGNGCEANVVADKDTWQGVTREPISVNKSDVESIVVEKDLNELMSDDLVEKPCLNGDKDSFDLVEGTVLKWDHQDLVSNELVPDGIMETDELNEAEVNTFLIPKTRGEHQITEKEGEYYVSDLVWGKVKSHPWWPGQIFPPIAASDKATKHFRNHSYLIAYFGDHSFAWTEGSNIKPFRMHFSQMEKQSNSDGFCHAVSCALDEVTRRVEFGLSCPCLSEEMRDKIKTQAVSNAGILKDKIIIDGGDHLSGPASFLPGKLVQFLESAAECPKSITDRLQFTVAKAQLLAFSRWKGYYELPVFEHYIGLLDDDDTRVTVKEEGNDSKNRKSTAHGSSQKRKHPSGEKDRPTTKEKRISALLSLSSFVPNVDENPVKQAGRRPGPSGNSNCRVKRRKRLLPASPVGDGENKSKLRLGEESELVEIIPDEIPTPDVILSKLILAAKVPIQEFNVMISEVDFLREFRNLICLEKIPTFRNAKMDKGKQPSSLETADTSRLGEKDCPTTKEKRITALLSLSSFVPNVDENPVKQAGRRPGPTGNSNCSVKRRKRLLPTSPVGDCENKSKLRIGEESELVEIIPDEIPTPGVILSKLILAAKVPIQGFSVMISEVDFLREFRNLICLELPTFGNAKMDKGKQPSSLEAADTSRLGFEGIEDSYWTDRIIQDYSQEQVLFKPENPNDKEFQVEEEADIKERDTIEPTALVLNFSNLDLIPDVANLNEIFGRYGPVKESETEILRKSKRVKVIFKRRADAETAFSSTGKYSIFGPSLLSYSLHYDPTPRKARGKRNKDRSLKEDA